MPVTWMVAVQPPARSRHPRPEFPPVQLSLDPSQERFGRLPPQVGLLIPALCVNGIVQYILSLSIYLILREIYGCVYPYFIPFFF